jgi:hypothetical protein
VSDRRTANAIGGLAVHAKHGTAVAERARAGFMRKFEAEVDPDGALAPAEREFRARMAMKRHMAQLRKRK